MSDNVQTEIVIKSFLVTFGYIDVTHAHKIIDYTHKEIARNDSMNVRQTLFGRTIIHVKVSLTIVKGKINCKKLIMKKNTEPQRELQELEQARLCLVLPSGS